MSKNLEKVINRLQYDWNFIADFFDNPAQALKEYNLKAEEKEALLARNSDDLIKLGADSMLLVGALSGAHSQLCTTRPIRP